MKIALINSVVDYGSTGKIVRDIATTLKAEGHTVCMIYGRHPIGEESHDTYYMGSTWATYVHVGMTRLLGRHGLHSHRQTVKMLAFLERFQPDVIHLHNLHGYYLDVPTLFNYLKTFRGKVVWTLHDCWAVSGSSAYFDYHGCKVWDEGCVECNSTQDYPEVWGIKRQRQNFAWKKDVFTHVPNMEIVTPSVWLKDLVAQTFLNKYPLHVIHNGIDLDAFRPQPDPYFKDLVHKKIYLGVASIWEPRKGLEVFLELAHLCKEDEVVVLVGVSDSLLKRLPPTIIGVKRTQNVTELAQLYSQATVFVNPTLEDNFPTTNLESLACGTPVVTFDTGGCKEALDAETGQVLETKTGTAVYQTLQELKVDTRLRRACRQRAIALFDKKEATQKYVQLLMK